MALVATAFVLCAPSAAGATVTSSGGFKYVTKDFTLQPGKARTKRAECPNGTHVLSGGHYNSGGFGDVIGAHSYPYDGDDRDKKPDDGWRAQLRGIGVPVAASVHAICTGRVFPEYAKRTDSVLPDGEEDLTAVPCDPSFLDETGGGSRGPALVREVEGYPGGDDWTVGLANHGGTAEDVTVYAVCAPLPQNTFGENTPVLAPEDQQTLTEGTCPPSRRTLSGRVSELRVPEAQGLSAIAATRPGSRPLLLAGVDGQLRRARPHHRGPGRVFTAAVVLESPTRHRLRARRLPHGLAIAAPLVPVRFTAAVRGAPPRRPAPDLTTQTVSRQARA